MTIREHQGYAESVVRELDQLRYSVNILEQTRPTTGELSAGMIRRGDK